LLEIYAGFAEVEITEVEKKYNGKGYGDFKKDLGELVSDKLDKLQGQYTAIRSNEAKLLQIVEQGNVKARQISNKKLEEVKEKIGLL
jgi:tryptophanyl-tRNA synthetase